MVALPPGVEQTTLFNWRRQTINHDIVAALGGVNKVKSLVWVSRWISSKMVRDWTRITIVPVADPGESFTRIKIDYMGTAT